MYIYENFTTNVPLDKEVDNKFWNHSSSCYANDNKHIQKTYNTTTKESDNS